MIFLSMQFWRELNGFNNIYAFFKQKTLPLQQSLFIIK